MGTNPVAIPNGRIQRVRGRGHHGLGPHVERPYAIWIFPVQTLALIPAVLTP
jgi:hypothetical protein